MVPLSEVIASFDARSPFVVPETWKQGRTAYGGLTAALAVAAAHQSADTALPPLRAAQFTFSGPAAGELDTTARKLRQGRSATSYAVTTTSGDDVAAQSSLIFAGNRPSEITHSLILRPDVPGPEKSIDVNDAPGRPPFAKNFDMRLAGGAAPMSQARTPELIAWLRHRDAEGTDPYVALVALGDGLPPASMTAFAAPAPISSMNWTVNICADEAPDGTGWFLLRSTSTFAADGYSFQIMEAWDEAGQLVMTGSQTVAIFA